MTGGAACEPYPRRHTAELAASQPCPPLSGVGPTVGDFIALMKPRVMSLVVFTAFTGFMAAPAHLHPVLAAVAIAAIAAGAGASGALNMWYDADIDARMARTAARPLPRGHIAPEDALGFGLVLAVGSVLTLGVLVNWTAGALLALTIAFYILVYTMWLKRRTPQNIVIGGAAGALPPMIGWAAATGNVSLESFWLFLIIFIWTPPHFWALAILRTRDYERVGVPMLPAVAGPAGTCRQILFYSFLLLPISLLPTVPGVAGLVYASTALVMGVLFCALGCRLYKAVKKDGTEQEIVRAARQLFAFSILYLYALFGVLLAGHILAGPILGGHWAPNFTG